MENVERDFNGIISVILSGVMLAAFGVQFIYKEEPCPLCLLQRLGMIAVSAGALLNVRFHPRAVHYGLMLLGSVFGGFVALRQISLHVCPGMPAFGLPVLGLSLYTWSFIVFVCCIAAVSLLLFIHRPYGDERELPPLNGLEKFALGFALLIAFGNAVAALMQCGLGVCEG